MTTKQKSVTAGVVAVAIVAGVLLKNALTIVPVPVQFAVFEMRYPPGKSEKDFKLSLEFSTNMRDWQDKWFQLDGAGSWHVWHSNEHEFYRQRASPL